MTSSSKEAVLALTQMAQLIKSYCRVYKDSEALEQERVVSLVVKGCPLVANLRKVR